MKFQKHLEWHRVPDWRDSYFNYKQLKKDLKKVKHDHQAATRVKIDVDTVNRIQELGSLFGESSRSPSQGSRLRSLFGSSSVADSWVEESNDFMVVHKKSLRTYVQDEVVYETELRGPSSDAEYVRLFFAKLDSQLNNINYFYKHKENEYVSHARQLQSQLELLFENQGSSKDGGEVFAGTNPAQAAKLLRAGFIEFYRSLGHLKNYSALNRMAFGKILKKHDKVTGKCASETYLRAVNMSHFSTSDKILRMMEQVMSMFTDYFLKGNRRKALACMQPMRQPSSNLNFVLGLFTGCSFSLIVTFVLLLTLPHNHKFPSVQIAFPMFSTLVLFLLHMYVYACNIYIWRKSRINYAYIFEFEPRSQLKYQDVLLLSTLITMLLIAAMVFYLVLYTIPTTSDKFREFVPLGALLVWIGVLVLPFNVFYKPARSGLFYSLLRIMVAPLFKVELADFFLADQLTSQVTALKNLGFTLCYYGGNNYESSNGESCTSKFALQYPLVVIAYWWRLMQSLRRWVDLRDPVHLANAGKYLSAIVAMVMKITYKWSGTAAWKSMFVLSSLCATAYQLYWDLVMDWGLLQKKASNRWLRDKLMFERKSLYYSCMLINTLLRLLWLFSLFHLELGATKSFGLEFILAAFEICRRGMWNVFRLENEHVNNVGKYRAIKVVPLPFEERDYAYVGSPETSSARVVKDA
ncbi:phosphate transporter PHO1-like [Selaginella moellendorffii]|uniref:phosphate transporter PHO1-like n=1 Tax=Selaginella moellendorffii TaxID=88036 RepID=UPI000D1CB688|nr:phosphate transporter PHO1-like [Selaginella moellendorffii]|eukprot:XP_024544648.1 phosphate transporter PHO1-like [Selaginella moellendorffii]